MRLAMSHSKMSTNHQVALMLRSPANESSGRWVTSPSMTHARARVESMRMDVLPLASHRANAMEGFSL